MKDLKDKKRGDMKKIKRETSFIKDMNEDIYLPRPTSWLSGWMRHKWFSHLTESSPSIASPDFWKQLSGMYTVMKLVEYENGSYEIINNHE